MTKLSASIVLCLVGFISHSQLSLHLSAYTGSKIGLETNPYGKSTFEVPFFYGAELGYRVKKTTEMRVFGYRGHIEKGEWFDRGAGHTKSWRYGFSTQVTLLSSRSGRFNFDLGFHFSRLEEETEWADGVNVEFFSFPSNLARYSAFGLDKATFDVVGVAPKCRFYFKRARLGLEIGVDISAFDMISSSREVYSNTFPDYDYSEDDFSSSKYGATVHLSVGHYFW